MEVITDAKPEERREARIQEHMKVAGMLREEAEFVVAMELGEVEGDVIVVDEGEEE